MIQLKPFLKTYKNAGALNSLLAPHAFVDEYVFLTKANQVGVLFQVAGIDDECLTEETLANHTKRVSAAFRGFSEQFRIYQYVVKQDRAAIEQGREFHSEAVRRTVVDRREHLESKASGLYSLKLYFAVLYEPSGLTDQGTLKRMFSTKKVLRLLAHELERNRTVLMGQASSFERTIGDLLGLTLLGKQDVFSFFRLLCNLDPELADSEHLTTDKHVDYHLASAALSCSDTGIQLGEADIEVLSMRDPPAQTFPNVLRDLLALQINFILCSEFKRIVNEKAATLIRTAQKYFFWSQWVSDVPSVLSMVLNRGKRENVIVDKSALNDKDELDDSLARIVNRGEYIGEFSFTVVLYGWGDKVKLQRAAADVVKIFGNHEGSLFRESYNALNAYLSLIPGNHPFGLRHLYLHSKNYADLSFVYSPYTGEKRNQFLDREHLVVQETNEALPYYFSLHQGDRLGTLLFGAPGSGKSVLANLLIDHSQKDEPRTFILDLGNSYRQITEKHGGSYLHMQFAEGKQSFRINPFVLPGTPDNLQFLSQFIRLLLTNAGYQPTAEDERQIFEALEGEYIPGGGRTLSSFVEGLPKHLADRLHAWTGRGQYGSVFDNQEDTLTFAHFQTFDFSGMDEIYPKVMEPLLFYIFQRIAQIVYDPKLLKTYKQLWADEAWRFLSNETSRKYLVAAGKTWRKHNGGIALITQSAEDLRAAGILELVNEICPVKILLANAGADRAEYQRLFRLNDKEVDLFASLKPKQQFLLKTEERAKVLNVNLDRYAFWQYANSPYENEQRQAAIQQYGFTKGLEVLAREAS